MQKIIEHTITSLFDNYLTPHEGLIFNSLTLAVAPKASWEEDLSLAEGKLTWSGLLSTSMATTVQDTESDQIYLWYIPHYTTTLQHTPTNSWSRQPRCNTKHNNVCNLLVAACLPLGLPFWSSATCVFAVLQLNSWEGLLCAQSSFGLHFKAPETHNKLQLKLWPNLSVWALLVTSSALKLH